MPGHTLVVGGTGMLSELVRALAGDGERLSLLSRQASAAAGDDGFDCDYHDQDGFRDALDRAVARSGPIDLAVVWFHTLKIDAPRLVAERVAGRMVQILGSATADPAHPERLEFAQQIVAGLPGCDLRQVVLGFKVEDGQARWLTNTEISQGVLEAVGADRSLTIVGQVKPWSARP
jgi:hypothetical protein